MEQLAAEGAWPPGAPSILVTWALWPSTACAWGGGGGREDLNQGGQNSYVCLLSLSPPLFQEKEIPSCGCGLDLKEHLPSLPDDFTFSLVDIS